MWIASLAIQLLIFACVAYLGIIYLVVPAFKALDGRSSSALKKADHGLEDAQEDQEVAKTEVETKSVQKETEKLRRKA